MNTYSTAVALGTLAGMRTNSAPAAASRLLSNHPSGELEHTPLAFMQRKGSSLRRIGCRRSRSPTRS